MIPAHGRAAHVAVIPEDVVAVRFEGKELVVISRREIRGDLAETDVEVEDAEHCLSAIQLPGLGDEEMSGGVNRALSIDDAPAGERGQTTLGDGVFEEHRTKVEGRGARSKDDLTTESAGIDRA